MFRWSYVAALTVFWTVWSDVAQGNKFEDPNKEKYLKRYLLNEDRYDKMVRPVRYYNDSLTVTIGLSLYHVLATSEKQQTLHALYSLRFSWKDEHLMWNPVDYDGVKNLWIPSDMIWTPDIMLMNMAADEYKPYATTNAVIDNTGQVVWEVFHPVKSSCSIEVRYYPFDEQECSLKFISWTYSAKGINLTFDPDRINPIFYRKENQEWEVTTIVPTRNEAKYVCCPDEIYPDVTFTLHMRRRGLFYVTKLIVPSVMIYILSTIGLLLPIDLERVNMETTVLLTLVVFLLMVSDIMPPTEATPLISILFIFIMLMLSLAVAESIFMCHLQSRPGFGRVPRWAQIFIKISVRPFYDQFYVPVLKKRQQLATENHTENPAASDHQSDGDNDDDSASSLSKDGFFNCDEMHEWIILSEALDRLFLCVFLLLSLALTTWTMMSFTMRDS